MDKTNPTKAKVITIPFLLGPLFLNGIVTGWIVTKTGVFLFNCNLCYHVTDKI